MAIKGKISQIFKKTYRRSYTYKLTKEGRTLKGVPNSKLSKFSGGSILVKNSPYFLRVISASAGIWTDGSMEQIRKTLLKKIKTCGITGGYFVIRVAPHELIRHHKMATSGKVDRISQGMRLAYGVPIARYARISPGINVINFHVKEKKDMEIAKKVLVHLKHHLPFTIKVNID